MILRDPIHGLVEFDGAEERLIMRLLGCREVQRLRRIRQLGLASLVFPGAEHSRFSHAIGTAHVMSRLLAHITRISDALPKDARLDAQARSEALAAALLHDVGHGPFSHLFEEVLPDASPHERWTEALILDPACDVHNVLAAEGEGVPERVAGLVRGEHRLSYLAQSVSGTLDVDRCDYLLRDSHMTGVSYGIYDLDWLLRALSFGQLTDDAGTRHWVLAIEGRKGLPQVEGFFLARNFMFQQVYHHKAIRAAEVLLRSVLSRASELLRDGTALEPTPAGLVRAARGQAVTIGEYLELDDHSLSHSLNSWQHAADPELADLSRRFVSRVLPKTLPLPDAEAERPRWERCLALAREIAAGQGLAADRHVVLDVPSDEPFAEPTDRSPSGLWVSLRHKPMARLGDVSFLLRELRHKRILRPRLVVAPELRDAISRVLEPVLA